jgi:hypothetical protein
MTRPASTSAAVAASEGKAAVTDHGLRADVVGFGDAEHVHRAGRLGRSAGPAERDHLLHRGEQVRVDPDLDGRRPGALVSLVLISPNATVLTVTL